MIAASPRGHSTIERVVFALVTRGWDSQKLQNYEALLRERDTKMSTEAAGTFASIDTKAAGVLTHVSMMIAGLGLLAPLVASNQVELGLIIVEITVYLLIAIGCLRCLSVFHTHQFVGSTDEIHDMIRRELIIRTELFSLCSRGAIAFTVVAFLLLPALYIWTPGK